MFQSLASWKSLPGNKDDKKYDKNRIELMLQRLSQKFHQDAGLAVNFLLNFPFYPFINNKFFAFCESLYR
jgi:hypothetical protein